MSTSWNVYTIKIFEKQFFFILGSLFYVQTSKHWNIVYIVAFVSFLDISHDFSMSFRFLHFSVDKILQHYLLLHQDS